METEEEKGQDNTKEEKDNEEVPMIKESSVVSEHVTAINFILKFESLCSYFRTCIIAECENCWIINGKIYKKEVIA